MVLTASDSSFAIFATFAAILHSCSGQAVSLRNDKLLNVFNIVKFPNDGCTTSTGTYGVCYTASECDTLGSYPRVHLTSLSCTELSTLLIHDSR